MFQFITIDIYKTVSSTILHLIYILILSQNTSKESLYSLIEIHNAFNMSNIVLLLNSMNNFVKVVT